VLDTSELGPIRTGERNTREQISGIIKLDARYAQGLATSSTNARQADRAQPVVQRLCNALPQTSEGRSAMSDKQPAIRWNNDPELYPGTILLRLGQG
jgi:hypothetical protein